MSNPWNLTECQVDALSRTIECAGREKVAADRMGVCRMTLTNRVRRAKEKMGVETRIAALLEFDRWKREQA